MDKQRLTDKKTYRDTDKQIYNQTMDKQRFTDKKTYRHIDRHTD